MKILQRMVGRWEGHCKTWFEPGKLGDESAIGGEFVSLFGGSVVRHLYKGSMMGKPRTGEETICFNSVDGLFQTSWFDDFHMNYALMFSQGSATEKGFSVTGKYSVGAGQPQWGWRTEYELIDDDHLNIIAYNISPDGEEARAVETKYVRSR